MLWVIVAITLVATIMNLIASSQITYITPRSQPRTQCHQSWLCWHWTATVQRLTICWNCPQHLAQSSSPQSRHSLHRAAWWDGVSHVELHGQADWVSDQRWWKIHSCNLPRLCHWCEEHGRFRSREYGFQHMDHPDDNALVHLQCPYRKAK